MPNQKIIRNYGIYDVDKIHKIAKKIDSLYLSTKLLKPIMNSKLWDSNCKNCLPFSPNDILSEKIKNISHLKQIKNADNTYPIIILNMAEILTKDKKTLSVWGDIKIYGKYDVLDGLHRLASQIDEKYIEIIIVPYLLLQKARID